MEPKIEIIARRADAGYDYEGRVNGEMVVGGWVRGRKAEAIAEARERLRERGFAAGK